jgi:hypothetical protein
MSKASESTNKAKSKSTSKAKSKAKAKPKAKAKAQGTKPRKRTRPKPKPKAQAKPKPKAASKTKAKSKAKAKGKAKAVSKSKSKSKAEAKEPKETRTERLVRQYLEAHPPESEEERKRFERIEASIQSMPAGLICPFSVSVRGGRHNRRTVLDTREEDGSKITEYEGVSIEEDPKELRRADSVKQYCYRAMRKVGVTSPHLGVIVPASKRKDLYRAIAQVEYNVNLFNQGDGGKAKIEKGEDKGKPLYPAAKTCELVFSYRGPLDSSGSNSSSAEAVVLDQMARLLSLVDEAQTADEAAVLARAPKGSLPRGLTSKDVLTMEEDDRRSAVARVRAELARKAVAEVSGFEYILPEEASIPLTNAVDQIRMAANAWTAGAAEGDEAYQQALKATDLSGLTRQQEHLVKAAADRRQESLKNALGEAGVKASKLELHVPAGAVEVPNGKDGKGSGKDGKGTKGSKVKKGSQKPVRLVG